MILPGPSLCASLTAQGPAPACAFSLACVSAGGSLVQWEGCEPALVGSCHLISQDLGLRALMPFRLYFLILAEMDNSSQWVLSGSMSCNQCLSPAHCPPQEWAERGRVTALTWDLPIGPHSFWMGQPERGAAVGEGASPDLIQ